jgi:hypothetical protein
VQAVAALGDGDGRVSDADVERRWHGVVADVRRVVTRGAAAQDRHVEVSRSPEVVVIPATAVIGITSLLNRSWPRATDDRAALRPPPRS